MGGGYVDGGVVDSLAVRRAGLCLGFCTRHAGEVLVLFCSALWFLRAHCIANA